MSQTFLDPSEPARLRRAFIYRRSYLFRAACGRHAAGERLGLDLCRALWRVACVKASRVAA